MSPRSSTTWSAYSQPEYTPHRIHNPITLLVLYLLLQVINDLVGAYNSIDKVDKMVLPFPYAQLLKVLMLV